MPTSQCSPRCHYCILAARSDYFRALLERSLSRAGPDGAGSFAAGAFASAGSGIGQGTALPEAVIGGVGPDAFEVVLRFVYTDSIAELPSRTDSGSLDARKGYSPEPSVKLPPAAEAAGCEGMRKGGSPKSTPAVSPAAAQGAHGWLDAERAEELLFAADLFLLFSLKVGGPWPAHCIIPCGVQASQPCQL